MHVCLCPVPSCQLVSFVCDFDPFTFLFFCRALGPERPMWTQPQSPRSWFSEGFGYRRLVMYHWKPHLCGPLGPILFSDMFFLFVPIIWHWKTIGLMICRCFSYGIHWIHVSTCFRGNTSYDCQFLRLSLKRPWEPPFLGSSLEFLKEVVKFSSSKLT